MSVPDGYGGSTINSNFVQNIWANVREQRVTNYDTTGSSQNKTEKLITVRYKDLDTNTNFFVIDGKGYQINDYIENYKKNQFECFCEATNFEYNG
jgi:SPP1 family predicted phage head-tail adaptor